MTEISKVISAVVIYLLVTSNCSAQFTINSYQNVPRLIGAVDSVVTKEFSLLSNRNTTPQQKELVFKKTFIYDADQRLIEEEDCSFLMYPHTGRDSRPVKWIYKYDIAGNMIDNTRFFTTGQPWVKETYTINGSHIDVNTIFLPNNSSPGKAEFIINQFNKIAERRSYMTTGELYITDYYKHDKKGQQTADECYRGDGSLMFKNSSKYDDKSNLIDDNNPYGDKVDHTFVYSNLDDKGNWLTRTEYYNGSPSMIYERIIYYRKSNRFH